MSINENINDNASAYAIGNGGTRARGDVTRIIETCIDMTENQCAKTYQQHQRQKDGGGGAWCGPVANRQRIGALKRVTKKTAGAVA